MVSKPYVIQSMNVSHEDTEWENEKREISLERAIEAAERQLASDHALGFDGWFWYRIIDDRTDEELWRS